ncbi:hypothetical protein [Halorubellus litoreus]|uniref:ABC-2 type transport system permease protein n=1 Tax=Halorubellus litoreus TaxID=755308 RepID=A0ABD5VBJ5_9EURY
MKTSLSKSLRIAGIESVRQLRQLRERPALAAMNVLPVLLLIPTVVGQAPIPVYEDLMTSDAAYSLGERLAAGESTAVLETIRTVSVGFFLFLGYLVALPELTEGGVVNELEGLLVTVAPGEIALGEMVTYVGFTIRLGGAIVVAAALAFGAGVGSAAAAAFVLLAGAAAILTAVGISYPAMLGVQLAFRRVRWLRENKALVAGPIVVVGFLATRVLADPLAVVHGTPLAWYADLALLGTAAETSLVQAGVVLAAGPLVFVCGALAAGRVGASLWYADDRSTTSTDASSDSPGFLPRLARKVATREAAAVARVTWWRVRRRPRVLLFGGLLLSLTISAGAAAVNAYPTMLPYAVATYGAATFGVGTTLNPLGNEGPMLPATLTTPEGGATLLNGHALAASIPGTIVVGVATLAAGVTTTLPLSSVLAVTVLGVVLGATGPFISLAIGVSFPQFEGISIHSSRGMYPPRLQSVMLYLVVVLCLGVPALVGVYGPETVATVVPVPPAAAAMLGVAGSVVASVTLASVAYRFALGRVTGFELAS